MVVLVLHLDRGVASSDAEESAWRKKPGSRYVATRRYVDHQRIDHLHTITPEIVEGVFSGGGPQKLITIPSMTERLVY